MKPLSRIAALVVMLSPAWIVHQSGLGGATLAKHPLPELPARETTAPCATLRYAISGDLVQRFAEPRAASDPAYDPLSALVSAEESASRSDSWSGCSLDSGTVSLPFSRQISRYARLIAKHSEAVGLDWRLVAALISEESSFEHSAVSIAGARGLMQLMPWVPGEVGVDNISKPESNIRAGVLYLSRLAQQYPEARPADRLAFVLASYMLGPGHVADARLLAREHGLDPHAWRRGLEETLPLLEDERFNRDTRFGYARGRQAVNYTNRILDRFDLYRDHFERDPTMRVTGEPAGGSA